MAEYMTVENNIITGIYCGYEYTEPQYDEQGEIIKPSEKIIPQNSVELPTNHEVRVGEPLTFYNKDYTRKSDIELMQENLIPIPQGYKIENDNLIEMTYDDKVIAGLEELPRFMKIVGDEVVPMTEEEKLNSMTEEEKTTYHRQERDRLLNAELWKLQRHEQEKALSLPTTLTDEQYLDLLKYIQLLRDLPQQDNFPNTVMYPERPE